MKISDKNILVTDKTKVLSWNAKHSLKDYISYNYVKLRTR